MPPTVRIAKRRARPWSALLLTLLLTLLFGAAASRARAQQEGEATVQHPVVPAQQAIADMLAPLYARYLSDGRSDVEIHLSATGPFASARVTGRADGTFSCHVSGLPVPSAAVDAVARLQLAGMLVHEATHCLVGPYIGELRRDAADPESTAANRLLALSAESISDARAVIEIFRRDGGQAAHALVALMLPQRLNPAAFDHATAMALEAALALTVNPAGKLAKPEQAFAAALEIGRSTALQTLQLALQAEGRQNLLQTETFKELAAALDAGLARALRQFGSGRFANNAVTLRASNDRTSATDRHFFVGSGGTLRHARAIGAEGAHSLETLEGMLASEASSEQRLAGLWLLREGRLEPATLAHSRAVIARFIQAMADGSDIRRANAVRILEDEIAGCRPGEGLSALLDAAAQRIRSAPAG